MKKLVLSLLFVFAVASLSFAAPKPWTNEEEKKISLFFSNFAEVFLDDFAENELSDSIMLNFAQGHIFNLNIPDDLVSHKEEDYAGDDPQADRDHTGNFGVA